MLTLICGLARSGKTTLSKQYEDTIKVVHLDRMGYDNCNRYASRLDEIVVEGIYDTRRKRERLIQAYKGERKVCIWLDTPKEVRMQRKGYHKIQEIPFEPPTLDEGWDDIIRIGPEGKKEEGNG